MHLSGIFPIFTYTFIMKSSGLHLRKISLIEYLLNIQDEKTFSKIELTIQKV
jgi:hypothetical protein